jgi:hypothetical protein
LVGVSGEDSTEPVLNQPHAVLAFSLDFKNSRWVTEFKTLSENAGLKKIPVYVASTNRVEAEKAFGAAGISGVQFFNTDFTVVRTVARTSPTILLLNRGTIQQKFSRNGIAKASASLTTP